MVQSDSSPIDPSAQGQPFDQPDLVRLACAGNPEAFGELFKAGYHPVLRRLEKRRFDDPEELAQRAWVRAWEKREQYRPPTPFLTWVTQIGHNLGRDGHRRASVFKRIIEQSIEYVLDWTHSAEQARPHQPLQNRENRALLKAALDQLSPEHRQIIELRELEGLSYNEIADILGCPRGTVMSRLSAARQNLIKSTQSIPL